MREELLKAYERFKRVKTELCVEDVEKLKKQAYEIELRTAIYYAEKYRSELKAMLSLMECAEVITKEESEKEKKEIEKLFSPKQLFNAEVRFSTGNLKLYVSEPKKED